MSMMRARRSKPYRISWHDPLTRTAVRRGIEGVRPVFYPAFVILALSIPLLIWTHNLFISKPSQAWLLLIPFMGKSPHLALAGVVFIFIGGVLGLARGRWLHDLRMVAFVSGCVTAAFLGWMLDVILKLFSFSANPTVHFLIRNPAGLLLALLEALLLGLTIGFLGYVVILVPAFLIWRKPVSRKASMARLALGLVLLPTGVYFAFLFHPDRFWFYRLSYSTEIAVTLWILAAVSILAGATMIMRSPVPLREKHRIAFSTSVIIILIVIFLVQVELFGLWLRNDDFVYAFINRMFVNISSIKSGPIGGGDYYSLLPSPRGDKILRSGITGESQFSSQYSILDETGKTISVNKPPGITLQPGRAIWSLDGKRIIGTGWKSPDLPSKRLLLWSYSLDDGTYKIADTDFQRLDLHPDGWSTDGKQFAAISQDRPVWLNIRRGQYFDVFVQSGSGESAVSLVDGDTLTVSERFDIPHVMSRWICFLDEKTILFQKLIAVGESSEEARAALVKKDLITGKEELINTRLGPATGNPNAPCLVRDRKWMLTAMSDNGKVVPILVELATGKIEHVNGLEGFKSPYYYSSAVPVLWDYAVADREGNRAVVPMYKESHLWPHASDSTILAWEEGKGFREFLPQLTQKEMPFLEASGSIDFYWNDDYQRFKFSGESN